MGRGLGILEPTVRIWDWYSTLEKFDLSPDDDHDSNDDDEDGSSGATATLAPALDGWRLSARLRRRRILRFSSVGAEGRRESQHGSHSACAHGWPSNSSVTKSLRGSGNLIFTVKRGQRIKMTKYPAMHGCIIAHQEFFLNSQLHSRVTVKLIHHKKFMGIWNPDLYHERNTKDQMRKFPLMAALYCTTLWNFSYLWFFVTNHMLSIRDRKLNFWGKK